MAGDDCDVVMVGGGIMSATLGTLLRKLEPSLRIAAFERLDQVAAESSDAWNNAGTGHAGYCELNYTPATADGAVDCSKALGIAAQFAQSLELWRALVAPARRLAAVSRPRVQRRSRADHGVDSARHGRPQHRHPRRGNPDGAARGTDVNFGALTRCMFDALTRQGVTLHLGHEAKVYGMAEVGAPPMSVPHLDTRWIADDQQLLFGPYAGITTKFLKEGSWLDLLRSIGIHNVRTMLSAAIDNFALARYLIGQAMLSVEERVSLLRRYCPSANDDDWRLQVSGLRVQIIKSNGRGGGDLKFGTEVLTSADGTVAALLGASPGASTAVSIMLGLLERCFPARCASAE